MPTRRPRGRFSSLALSWVVALVGCTGPVPAPPSSPSASVSKAQQSVLDLYSCLQTKGWPVEVSDDGMGIELTGIPSDQVDRYNADAAECKKNQPAPTPLSQQAEQWWRDWYQAEVATNQCLAKEGVSVTDPPSFQAFKEAHLNGKGWTAWEAVDPAIGKVGYQALERACPQPADR